MTKTFNAKLFWIPTITLSLFLLAYYILQIGALSQKIYLILDYEKKLSILSEKNEFLDIDLSKMDSLSNVEKYLVNKDFVKSKQIKYIRILESSVVSK